MPPHNAGAHANRLRASARRYRGNAFLYHPEPWRPGLHRPKHGAPHRHRCAREVPAAKEYRLHRQCRDGSLPDGERRIRCQFSCRRNPLCHLRFPRRSRRPSISNVRVKRSVWSSGEVCAVAIMYDASRRTTFSEKPAPTPRYCLLPLNSFS